MWPLSEKQRCNFQHLLAHNDCSAFNYKTWIPNNLKQERCHPLRCLPSGEAVWVKRECELSDKLFYQCDVKYKKVQGYINFLSNFGNFSSRKAAYAQFLPSFSIIQVILNRHHTSRHTGNLKINIFLWISSWRKFVLEHQCSKWPLHLLL